MNISSAQLPFQYVAGMDEAAYLEALCESLRLRICKVPSNGSCFFDSIYALLPTVGKAVKSARTLRLQIVQFFRECSEGRHGLLGERIMIDVHAAMEQKIVSSCAQTRFNSKKPKSVALYFDAVSMQSVWVDGRCTPHSISCPLQNSPSARISLAQSCRAPLRCASCRVHSSLGARLHFRRSRCFKCSNRTLEK